MGVAAVGASLASGSAGRAAQAAGTEPSRVPDPVVSDAAPGPCAHHEFARRAVPGHPVTSVPYRVPAGETGLARARAGPLGRPRHDRIADRGGVAEVRAGGARVLRDPARTPLRPTHRGAGQATRWDRCAHRAVPRPPRRLSQSSPLVDHGHGVLEAAFVPNAGEDLESVDNVDVFVDLPDGSRRGATLSPRSSL